LFDQEAAIDFWRGKNMQVMAAGMWFWKERRMMGACFSESVAVNVVAAHPSKIVGFSTAYSAN